VSQSAPTGATILDAEGLRLTADEIAFFRDADPFGFILFARNIDHPDQVRALCADMRNAVGRDCLITIDQEGGRVQRLRAPTWREWLPPLDFVVAAGDQAERAMYPVSYTPLTLPTICSVSMSVVASSLKKHVTSRIVVASALASSLVV